MICEQVPAESRKTRSAVSVATTDVTTECAAECDAADTSRAPIGLEILLGRGFTERDIKAIREGGFHNLESLAYAPDKAILSVKGVSEQKCEKLKEACRTIIGMGFMSAFQYLDAREHLVRFTTGSNELDRTLRGGVETGNITELCGEFRTGKTQLCHTLAVTCQLPLESSGGDGRCIWIDTEGTFRPERIVSIAERFRLDTHECLNNVICARAYNTDHLMELLAHAAAIMHSQTTVLLIVDSIISLYRSEFSGRGELAPRQMHLGRVLRMIQRLADVFGCAVVLTNQVMAKVDGMPGQDKMPAGGHVLAHSSQTRLFIRKGRGDTRICKILDSPSLPESEVSFVITEGGIMNAPQN